MNPRAPADVVAYYRDPYVRARLDEYCGRTPGAPVSAVFIVGFDPTRQPFPLWTRFPYVPAHRLDALVARGCDLSRSLWDTRALIVALDLDYQNVDFPGEPFSHQEEFLNRLEPCYAATRAVFRRVGLRPFVLATGRGYHFVGQVPLDDPAVDRIAALADLPAWYATREQRRPDGVTAEMPERQARAAAGLSLLIEYLAHRILAEAGRRSLVPIVFNGNTVGRGRIGRDSVSIDFSHAGDPLDTRHIRFAFSAYQWHRGRPDIFGGAIAGLPPIAAVPRRGSLGALITAGRDLDSARRAAKTPIRIPNFARGMERLVRRYERSALARFHRAFLSARRAKRARPGRTVPADLPPCLARPLLTPNDLLLKPEYLQHLVRGLLARDWSAADIAALVLREYERDHNWGDRWVQLDARTRADFDVRVFAGLVATGRDRAVDFNCRSLQEKGLCPMTDCRHDLREDRARLTARFGS